MVIADLDQREDLRRADNCGIHAGLTAVVKEYGIQRDPRCWGQAKAHIADAENNMCTRQVVANQPDRIHRGFGIQSVLLDAGGDGQRQRVVENLMGRNSKLKGVAISPLRNGELLLCRAGHSVFVDGADHHAGSIAACQLKHFEETFIPILVIRGVEDALATGHLQAGLHLLPLRGVEHQGKVDIGDQTADQFVHVAFTIATDVVDVDVQNMGVLLHLTARNGDKAVPVLLCQEFPHLAAAAGIESFADDQKRVVLVIRRDAIDR